MVDVGGVPPKAWRVTPLPEEFSLKKKNTSYLVTCHPTFKIANDIHKHTYIHVNWAS